jgi:hypothetical protein
MENQENQEINNRKKILSFDVGIKNLAYCLMERNNTELTILKWDIINLVEDRDLCEYKLRTGKNCGKIGRFTMKVNSTTSHVLCNAHKTKCKVEVTSSSDYNCVHVKCKEKSKINILDNSEWSWCDKHEKDSKKILTTFKPKKLTGQNCSQQPLQELAFKLFTKLDKDIDLIQVDEVLIENQPSLKNPNMKTIASILYSYFVMRGLIDKEKKSLIKNVKFISPSNKLKVDKSVTQNNLDKAKDKKEYYDITKGLGKIYCLALIKETEKHFLTKYEKQDDLCDCFLQGFQYLFTTLPQLYLDKISKIDHEKLNVKSIKSKKNKIKEEKVDDDKENNNKENDNKGNGENNNIDKVKISKTPRKKK